MVLFSARCSSMQMKLPGATIESSEVLGKGKKQLGPSLEPTREIEFTGSASSRPPNLDNAMATGATHNLLHQAHFGLGDRFELGGEAAFDFGSDLQTMLFFTGKFQFIGRPKSEAKRGDFSGSLFGRLGHTRVDGSGDQATLFGPGGFPWSAQVEAMLAMIGMSYGYRFSDKFMAYLGVSYQHMTTKIVVDQEAASDNSNPGGHYQRERDGQNLSYGLGAQWRLGKIFHLHGKLMMFNFNFDGIDDHEDLYAGGGFHFYF